MRPKPSPEGIWWIASSWGLEGHVESGSNSTSTATTRSVSEAEIDVLDLGRAYLGAGLIMVGDSIDDMAAGYCAGAATVLLVNEENEHLRGHEYCDLVVESLDELVGVLEGGFVGIEGG